MKGNNVRAKRTEAAWAESRGTSRKLLVGVMFAPVAAPFVWIPYGLDMPWATLSSVAVIQSVVLGENVSRCVPTRKLCSCNLLRSDSPRYLEGASMARADNDSWDLASSVGPTATMVAAARTVATRRPDPLINDAFAESLVKAVGSGKGD